MSSFEVVVINFNQEKHSFTESVFEDPQARSIHVKETRKERRRRRRRERRERRLREERGLPDDEELTRLNGNVDAHNSMDIDREENTMPAFRNRTLNNHGQVSLYSVVKSLIRVHRKKDEITVARGRNRLKKLQKDSRFSDLYKNVHYRVNYELDLDSASSSDDTVTSELDGLDIIVLDDDEDDHLEEVFLSVENDQVLSRSASRPREPLPSNRTDAYEPRHSPSPSRSESALSSRYHPGNAQPDSYTPPPGMSDLTDARLPSAAESTSDGISSGEEETLSEKLAGRGPRGEEMSLPGRLGHDPPVSYHKATRQRVLKVRNYSRRLFIDWF